MYTLISSFLFFLVKIFRSLNVQGREHIPNDQRYVVTCTHKGWVDVIMLALAVYPTQVHFMAKKELFQSNLSSKFFKSINAFPVNRENPGPSTLKTPLKLLKENKVVGIFPSGTRTSEDVPLKKGAVTIALKAKVPLVPAAYSGPENFSDILKGRKASIIFGKPIMVENTELNRDELQEQTLFELEKEMKKLERTFLK